jgi:hypothetical protein
MTPEDERSRTLLRATLRLLATARRWRRLGARRVIVKEG